MQHLNYCRQMVKQFQNILTVPSVPAIAKGRMEHCITLAGVAQKFLLPDRGYFLDDENFRALDETQPLRLPFRNIALEFSYPKVASSGKDVSSKRIVFANDGDHDDYILIRSVTYADHLGMWACWMACGIPRVNYLDRTPSPVGVPGIFLRQMERSQQALSELEDVEYEARVLLGMINALTCSNVKLERSSEGRTRRAMCKKGALPFDDYHVLTIESPSGKTGEGIGKNGDHRSPREHLRRGHIRRYESGAKIWVNATVVNPGIGGKVTKDYKMVAAHAV
tara:strand:+ start:657 stop:1496 length:840 start_codon:yes stop_codon:yes gene_type:complete